MQITIHELSKFITLAEFQIVISDSPPPPESAKMTRYVRKSICDPTLNIRGTKRAFKMK